MDPIETIRYEVSGGLLHGQWCDDEYLTEWGRFLVGKVEWCIVYANGKHGGEIVAKFFDKAEAERIHKALQSGLTFFGPRDIPEHYKVVECEPIRTDKEGAEMCADRRPSFNVVNEEGVICNCPEDKRHYADWITHLYNNWAAYDKSGTI